MALTLRFWSVFGWLVGWCVLIGNRAAAICTTKYYASRYTMSLGVLFILWEYHMYVCVCVIWNVLLFSVWLCLKLQQHYQLRQLGVKGWLVKINRKLNHQHSNSTIEHNQTTMWLGFAKDFLVHGGWAKLETVFSCLYALPGLHWVQTIGTLQERTTHLLWMHLVWVGVCVSSRERHLGSLETHNTSYFYIYGLYCTVPTCVYICKIISCTLRIIYILRAVSCKYVQNQMGRELSKRNVRSHSIGGSSSWCLRTCFAPEGRSCRWWWVFLAVFLWLCGLYRTTLYLCRGADCMLYLFVPSLQLQTFRIQKNM